jgi:hypothetical protein
MPDASIVLPIIICAQMSGMPLGPLLEGVYISIRLRAGARG